MLRTSHSGLRSVPRSGLELFQGGAVERLRLLFFRADLLSILRYPQGGPPCVADRIERWLLSSAIPFFRKILKDRTVIYPCFGSIVWRPCLINSTLIASLLAFTAFAERAPPSNATPMPESDPVTLTLDAGKTGTPVSPTL